MASDVTQEIIDSILRLPLPERERVFDAVQESLIDKGVDHGGEEAADEVEAAWADEIARRIADIDSGRVKTIPAEEAERMIRKNARRKL
jgi:putative addiction module component (TIGR02574 family)